MTRSAVKWIVALAAVSMLAVAWSQLPIGRWIEHFNQWVTGQGAVGWLAFGVVYVVATVALVPGSALTLAAGLAFGLWAFPLVVVSAAIGAWLAFLVGRYLAREAVARRLASNARFAAVDQAVREEGWKIVALMRLSPLIPFNLQNYLFGLTDVHFWHYAWATLFGIMPGTLLYVYFGAAGRAALAGAPDGDGGLRWLFFGVGLAATLAVTLIVTRAARRRLDRMHVTGD